MVKYIQQLANDMMKSLELNALVNGDMYGDATEAVKKQKADLKEVRDMLKLTGTPDEQIREMTGSTDFRILSVCGTVSTVLCQIFLDTQKFNYRFDFENRSKDKGYYKDLMTLGNALGKRDEKQSHLLRVDCDSHSYVLYLPPSKDSAYLMQGNIAKCMTQFTLQEWMNSKKAFLELSMEKHYKLLTSIWDSKAVQAPYKDVLIEVFSINDGDKKRKLDPFKATKMTFVFREFDEASAVANVKDLYKRAGVH
ncbi:hypothetical protein [Vitiosangium sp. GDMCC 1.1324]|uniref:hypothetical protein n=1 Tax=Vitiosangium sp. (strain GDMCC 1.1324) TaxID=2138576 RepID=UPI000D371678|nr:hypothetical protein [Vitiosangium sp. GDMCC 1.1324]PTL78809.1 hypothetical protein DAT35_37765 [Vitiosangium sp. GDMCC 1.1324]